MSRISSLIFAVALALCALLAAAAVSACGDGDRDAPAASESPDPVVLRVDGRPVRLSAVESLRAEFRLGGASDARARAEKEAVRREILRREAERLGVVAEPGEVESRRDVMVEQAGGEDALVASLAQVPITDAQLRSGLEDGVLYQAVQDARFADLSATPAEARAYYEKNRESFREQGSLHLYSIRVAAERIAESALERVGQGRPFAEVARQFSTDPEAKAAGGDMGVVALASLPASFTDALEPASPGEVVGPVQGPGGWYLLKATDVKQDRVAPFAEVRDDLVAELTRQQRFRALGEWLDAARERASVTRP
jgi:parvulin-like peptidyl-prolyl isomerase